jgi:hypothetical protein
MRWQHETLHPRPRVEHTRRTTVRRREPANIRAEHEGSRSPTIAVELSEGHTRADMPDVRHGAPEIAKLDRLA